MTDPLGRRITYSANGVSYPGTGGATRNITISYGALQDHTGGQLALTYQQLFPEFSINNSLTFNPTVSYAVNLPDGSSYQLTYNQYGEVTAVKLPTGGLLTYE